jgi:hypothetical protein
MWAAVPEAAVYKQAQAAAREDQIGPAGKPVTVEPVSKAGSVKIAAHCEFGRSVLTADGRHNLAAPGGSYRVHWTAEFIGCFLEAYLHPRQRSG